MIVTFLGTTIFVDLDETVGFGIIVLEAVEVGDAMTWLDGALLDGAWLDGTGVGEGVGDALPEKEGLGVAAGTTGEGFAIGDSFAVGLGEGVGNLLGAVVGVAAGNGTPVTAE